MTMASSTSPPGTAGPSATSSGLIAFSRGASWAVAGAATIANRRSSQRNIGVALPALQALVEIGPQPPRRSVDFNSAPPGIFLKLILADARHAEILAVAVAEVESGHRRGRQHREILGQR